MDNFAKSRFNAEKRGEMLWYDPHKLVLVTDPTHPLYDERLRMPISEALVKSICLQGVLEPIVVRRNGETEDGPLMEVVDGRQRVRAAIEASKRMEQVVLVPAVVRRGDESDLIGAMVSANEVRIASDAMTTARKLKRYLDFGGDLEQASIICGTTSKGVRRLLALLDLAKPVQAALEAGEVSLAVARDLAAMPQAEQVQRLEALKEGAAKGKTAKERSAEVKDAKGARGKVRTKLRSPKEIREARDATTLDDVRGALDWVLGKRKTCPGRYSR